METKTYKSGCDIGLKTYNADCEGNPLPDDPKAKKQIAGPALNSKEELEQTSATMGVTIAKLTAMREYANLLAKSDKRMKPATVRKRVAEKFKIKLA